MPCNRKVSKYDGKAGCRRWAVAMATSGCRKLHNRCCQTPRCLWINVSLVLRPDPGNLPWFVPVCVRRYSRLSFSVSRRPLYIDLCGYLTDTTLARAVATSGEGGGSGYARITPVWVSFPGRRARVRALSQCYVSAFHFLVGKLVNRLYVCRAVVLLCYRRPGAARRARAAPPPRRATMRSGKLLQFIVL